jgi:UDP-galactopyranose mutase
MYEKYQALADAERHVIFGGRLGTYRYLDMHQAIGAALSIFERLIKPRYETNLRPGAAALAESGGR